MIDFSKNYGNLATFYEFGLARVTTAKRVKVLLEDIYGDKLQNVKFALFYGSRKEFSDIDVFVVSDNLDEIKTDWLDVRLYSTNDFEKKSELFDIAVTNPLMTGEFILGNRDYFEQSKQKILSQPVNLPKARP